MGNSGLRALLLKTSHENFVKKPLKIPYCDIIVIITIITLMGVECYGYFV